MSATEVLTSDIWEDGGATLMARITGQSAAAITQASLSTIACKVFDITAGYPTPDTATSSPTVTISSAVFDTLQTDARWTLDSTGYNFRFSFAASAFPDGDHTYLAEFKFTPASGEVFWLAHKFNTRSLRTS